jgi:DNA-binding PadR family transcriptional regulator
MHSGALPLASTVRWRPSPTRPAGARAAHRRGGACALAPLLEGPLHGYGIVKRRRAVRGRVRLAVATLYGALDRLHTQGLVEPAGEQIVDGRARRYWRITDPGRAALTAEAERLRAAATVVERLVAVGPVS